MSEIITIKCKEEVVVDTGIVFAKQTEVKNLLAVATLTIFDRHADIPLVTQASCNSFLLLQKDNERL